MCATRSYFQRYDTRQSDRWLSAVYSYFAVMGADWVVASKGVSGSWFAAPCKCISTAGMAVASSLDKNKATRRHADPATYRTSHCTGCLGSTVFDPGSCGKEDGNVRPAGVRNITFCGDPLVRVPYASRTVPRCA